MFYGISLGVVLVALWLVLSGHYTTDGSHPQLIFLGIVSILAALGLTFRMRIMDRETAPFASAASLFAYWGWLGGEIVKSNIMVTKKVMAAEVDIEPRLIRVPVDMDTDLARCVFANSITLTPGTVTVEVEADGYLVHALDGDFTDPAGFADMGGRSSTATDGKDEGATDA